MKKVFFYLAIILIFSISIYTVTNYNKNKNTNIESPNNSSSVQNSNTSKILSKDKALDFKLKDMSGKEVSLSDFKGKNVLINFWATWCPPCKAEMPDIERLYEENKNSDLVILAVNLGEDKETVKSFMDKNNYKFQVLLDSNQDVAVKYDISSIPTSFFVNKDGVIVQKRVGEMNLEEMRNYVASIKE
ncbi:TlpA disulfide reductase family protein [Clostridium sp. YIM B02551]|uniref:TlpA family protein disulfide reductase n=1 Tax=Clostridium sp. YIM B02551 TaxID=2910679 RepID=UPI001EEB52F3|nr:TlpA disulfide reductase family protein [Clostridium sp. YIM B02551]